MKEKLSYLDGLRGLAAFIVVIHHYTLGFYPAYAGNAVSKTPISLIYNGNFSVCVFFVLSGFVLSAKYFKTKNPEVLIASATKRYFRLLLPVLFSIVLAYIVLSFGLFSNTKVSAITGSSWLGAFYNFDANFVEMLKQGLYRVFLFGEASYNTNLWTIYLEFFGSLLTFAFLAFFGKLKKRYLVYILLIIVLYQSYYLAFLLGILLCDLYYSEQGKKLLSKNKAVLIPIFILALYFGSYPYDVPTQNTIYHLLNFQFLKNVYYYQFYHILGGFLMVYVLLSSKIMQKIFSHRFMLFLGNISFSLYVIHLVVLCSFSTALFEFLLQYLSYKVSFLAMFACSLALLFPLSYLSYKYIDISGVRFGNLAFSYLNGDRNTLFGKIISKQNAA
jgi:peptidoglycan/LPS O-acetylase OafA/YrhL